MYHRRLRKPSKPAIFAMLMLASAVMILLPRDFFGSARNMTQLVALPGYAVTRAADRVSDSARAIAAEPVPAQTHAEAVRARQAVEHENITLSQQVAQLQNLVGQLQDLRGHYGPLRHDGALIPARVVGWDAAPGRDSMVLLKGRSASAEAGDWVASRLAVQAGTHQGVDDELRVIGRETLIGWVEHTAPYLSRVALLSDRFSNRVWRVNVVARRAGQKSYDHVAHLEDPGRRAEFPLEGMGDGKMLMAEVEARYITEGRIQVGDVVTTDGHDPRLPMVMVIGDIVEVQQIKKKPLLYNVIVKHRWDPKDLTEVFIINMSR